MLRHSLFPVYIKLLHVLEILDVFLVLQILDIFHVLEILDVFSCTGNTGCISCKVWDKAALCIYNNHRQILVI